MNEAGLSLLIARTAVPAVAGLAMDSRPALLFDAARDRILWANAAAARALGESLRALVAADLAPDNPATLQVRRLQERLKSDRDIVAILRIASRGRATTFTFRCRRIDLPGVGPAMLAVDAAEPAGDSIAARAAALVGALAGCERSSVGIADEAGRLVALADKLAIGGEALLNGAAPGLSIHRERLETPAGRFTLIAALPAIGAAAATPAPPALPPAAAPAAPPAAQSKPPVAETLPAVRDAEPPRPPVEAPPPPAPEGEPPRPSLEAAPPPAAPVVPSPPPVAEAPLPAAPAEPPRAFAFVPQKTATRFTFTMDGDGRFTALSPAFAGVVGPEAADVVGRLWREVAAARGLDSAGAIAQALNRRDTWSGVTVYWPVDGADLAVAVDLAALPAFSRDRTFEGFRGFGVCRTSDTQPRGGAATPAPPAPAEPLAGEDMDAGPEPSAGGEVVLLPVAERSGSNVVRLPGKGNGERVRRPEPLSGFEEDAFRRIAEALGARNEAERAREAAAAGVDDSFDLGEPRTEAWQPIAPPEAKEEREEPAAPTAAPADPRFLDHLPLPVLVVQEGALCYANREALGLLGYADLAALVAAGGLPGLLTPRTGDSEGPSQPSLKRADGSPLPADIRLQAVNWGGRPAILFSLQKREAPPTPVARTGGAARVAELEAILDTATDGVIVIDAGARITGLNRSAEALFAVDSAAVAGQPFTTLLAEESHRAALDYLDGLAQNGVASVLNDGREVIGRMPAGGLIPLFMTVGRLGDTGKFCAVLRDITHWKKVEQELVAARRAAESANAQKSEFLAKISHEIRTPLNAIIGFSEVMMEERFGAIGNERYRGYLRDIHLSGAHLMSLINDLLDLSKIEAGKVELTFVAVAVNDVIQECVALMQPQANRERIIIRTSLAAALPNVVADTRSLRQIVLNLLSNAVKFTKAGGQVIVSTSLQETGEIVIRIRDTGVGMSEKDIETAMKPFRQISTSGRTRYDGTGLGLPLTKALVEANRATFSIDSAVDQGTLVKITFPTNRVLAG